MTMDLVEDLEPLPLEGGEGSPTGVVGVGAVPIAVWARTKRGAASLDGKRAAKARRRSGRRPAEEEEEEEEESYEEPKDGEDDDDNEDDGKVSSEEEDGSDEEPEGITIDGELRDAAFPGLTARGDPLFWHFSYRRETKGTEACWVCGSFRWASRERAAVWASMYAAQIGQVFSLSRFVEKLSDFAHARANCYRVAPVPAGNPRVVRPACPIPNFDPAAWKQVNVRGASNAELQLPNGMYVPKSAWKVTVKPARGPETVYYMLWSVWTRSPKTMGRLISEWGRTHPNASFETVDNLIGQVRVPFGNTIMTEEQVAALANSINYEPPPPAAEAPPAAPMDAL